MRYLHIGFVTLASCLLLSGCKEPGQSGLPSDQQSVFPDVVSAPAVPVDVAGALALTPNQVGTLAPDALASIPAGGRCALDSINGQEDDGPELSRTAAARFSGWVASTGPAPALAILLDGDLDYALPGEPLVDRPDIADAIGQPELRVSDFQAQVALGSTQAGTYTVHLLLEDGGTPVLCALNRRITLR